MKLDLENSTPFLLSSQELPENRIGVSPMIHWANSLEERIVLRENKQVGFAIFSIHEKEE